MSDLVVALMDWYSRSVLLWRLSSKLNGLFCRKALGNALAHGRPKSVNSNQGSQFTVAASTEGLERAEKTVLNSMKNVRRVW